MKRAWMILLAAGLVGMIGPVDAQDKIAQRAAAPKETHLGVFAAPVPPALYSQLPGVLARGDGVLILSVEKDSPAAKAGLQENDVLLTLDNQKLSSPGQLIHLVRHNKLGQQVSMSYVRGGKTMSSKATLTETEHPIAHHDHRVLRFYPDGGMRTMFDDFDSKIDSKFWDTFDALKLSRIGDKQWSAQIDFRAKDGKKETKSYKGTREEIRKAIEAEKELPANERAHLLRALNLQEPIFEFHFPLMEPFHGDRP